MRGRLIKGIVCVLTMFTLLNCTEQQARKPIQQSKSQHIENSVQENRLRLAREVEVIEQWLTSQTSVFSETPHGIFYSYSNPKNRPILPPENLKKIYVLFEHLNGEPIYDWKIFQNPVSNQDVPQGIVLLLPHIPIGVETSVVLTSFLAYGSSGDGSSIGPYTPIFARIYIPLIQNKSS